MTNYETIRAALKAYQASTSDVTRGIGCKCLACSALVVVALEAMRKDSERLDWCDAVARKYPRLENDGMTPMRRASIDAAMAEQEGEKNEMTHEETIRKGIAQLRAAMWEAHMHNTVPEETIKGADRAGQDSLAALEEMRKDMERLNSVINRAGELSTGWKYGSEGFHLLQINALLSGQGAPADPGPTRDAGQTPLTHAMAEAPVKESLTTEWACRKALERMVGHGEPVIYSNTAEMEVVTNFAEYLLDLAAPCPCEQLRDEVSQIEEAAGFYGNPGELAQVVRRTIEYSRKLRADLAEAVKALEPFATIARSAASRELNVSTHVVSAAAVWEKHQEPRS